ncbi:hypothetical protein [Thiocapsa rosea]|uniref:hypothetical protein n=1 Tax=Thiocapsa rosea TaxID=69360 RepID=UPI0011C45543|nr:hypothetical protein [Thiocapsa rosea]
MNDKSAEDTRGIDTGETPSTGHPAGAVLARLRDRPFSGGASSARTDSKSSSDSVKVNPSTPTRLNLEEGVEP